MANKYNIGDQVQLKSGGPTMTITDSGLSSNSYVGCTWFSGKKAERGTFPPEALKPVPVEPSDDKK